MPEPESAVSASAAAPSSELPPPASAESPAAPTPSAAATDAPAAGGKPKPNSHKEAHEPEPSATADAYSGPDPCQAKTFHYSAIGGACKKGGRKAVKDIMRGVVKKAKAAGQDVQCLSCHEDTSTFHLKSNAVSDIKQWL
jgi:hypothetical protein